MNAYHICSACRRSILVKARHEKLLQWQSRSMFVSLSNTRTTTDEKATDDPLRIADAVSLKNGKTKPENALIHRKPPIASRKSRADLLESLFQESLTTTSQSSQLATPTVQAATLELYGHLETLKKLLANPNEPIAEVWQFFASNLGPRVWISNGISIPRPKSFAAVTGTLLQKLKMARQQSQVAAALPTITNITTTYSTFGLLRPADWTVLVLDLLRKLSVQTLNASQPHSPSEVVLDFPPASSDSIRMAEDILGAWRLLCMSYASSNRAFTAFDDRELNDWSFFSASVRRSLFHARLKGGVENVFQPLVPRYPKYHLKSMSSTALMTFALLTDGSFAKAGHGMREHPFIAAIARELIAARTSPLEINALFASQIAAGIINDIKIDWSSVLRRAEEIARLPRNWQVRTEHSAIRPLKLNSGLTHQKLTRALAERDLTQVNQLWAEVQLYASGETTESVHEPPQPNSTDVESIPKTVDREDHSVIAQELYNQFILTYMGLRQPDKAIDVWNHMINSSVQPTLSTWNAMLEGCKTARNSTSLEGVWAKLQASHIQPDMVCWTTRISGLIECGKPELAIRALDEMGRIWMAAAKKHNITDLKSAGDIGGVVKPTIETVNAAISGFLRRQHLSDYANRVLVWGGNLGIKPDIITFNTLLRTLVRDSRTESIQALLEYMQKQGVQADVATFTTILDEMFRTSQPQTPEEQSEIINNVFVEMEAAGVQANLRTYSKIIYSLLQYQSNDMEAVKAVMTRMAAQGLEPSTYIYTMLVKHHFTREQPDLEAIRSLIERIRLSGSVMDHIFWDRVIEGYARVGDTSSALTILARVDKEGARVGWPALEMVVSALAANGEWDLARQVAWNARMDRGGPPEVDAKGVEGQHSFWRTVANLKLLDA